MKTQSPQLSGSAGRGRLALRATTSAKPRAASETTMRTAKMAKTASGPISVRASSPYQRYQEVSAMRGVLLSMVAALLLATTACAAAGSGGSGAPKAPPGNATRARRLSGLQHRIPQPGSAREVDDRHRPPLGRPRRVRDRRGLERAGIPGLRLRLSEHQDARGSARGIRRGAPAPLR